MAHTTQVDVTFRLLSNLSGPPFNIADCSGVIYLDDVRFTNGGANN